MDRSVCQTKGYYQLPNEIFCVGLSPGELAVYAYLLRYEDRRTYQCWPSLRTIGRVVGMSANTVRKHICALADRGLIRTENTSIINKTGQKRNGNLRYTILPFRTVLERHYQERLEGLSQEATHIRCRSSP